MRDYGSATPAFRELHPTFELEGPAAACAPVSERVYREGLLPTARDVLTSLGELAKAAAHDLRATDELVERRLAEIDELREQNERAIGEALEAERRDADEALAISRSELADERKRLERRLENAREELRVAQSRGSQAMEAEAARRLRFFMSSKAELAQSEADEEQRCARRKREAAARAEQQRAQNAQACNDARDECQFHRAASGARVERLCGGPAASLVPAAAYASALNMEQAMRLDPARLALRGAEGYVAPPWLLLGSLYLPVSAESSSAGRSVLDRVASAAVVPAGEGSAVRMPLACNLAEGLQVVLRPAGDDEAAVRKTLRSLTLRLLLAYPPATLNVALVDPMRNGTTFSGLRTIVDIEHDAVLPEVIVDRGALRSRLESIRLRMAQHLGNYADPVEDGFFSHEAVQALVINDFPCGFDAASLSELAQIMVSGGALGTVVILSVNETYAKEFEKNADYQAIVGSRQAWRLAGTGNWLAVEGTSLFASVGEVEEVTRAEDAIIEALRSGICSSQGRTLTFADAFRQSLDVSAWRRESSLDGISIPIGMAGGTRRACVSLGQPSVNAAHHGLIAGATGSGKSVLMHTMITSALLSYSAEELQLVLIDFKEGVEFDRYVELDLPPLRSVTVTTEPELALAALRDVAREWERRSALGMDDYGRWRRAHPGEFMPRVLVVFDEVQELAGSQVPQEIRSECQGILEHIAQQGRSHGIHLFLASQTFGGQLTESLDRNMRCRIALDQGTGILEDDAALAQRQNGAAIINERGGDGTANQLVQVALTGEKDALPLLRRLEELYADPVLRARIPAGETRLYYSRVDANPRLPHNRLIAGTAPSRFESPFPRAMLGQTLFESWVEDGYERTGEECAAFLEENLLLVGNNFSTAEASVVNLVLSLCLDDVSRCSGGLPARTSVTLATFARERGEAVDPLVAPRMPVRLADLDALPCVTRASGLPRDRDRVTGRTPFEDALGELHALLEERRAAGYDGRDCRVLVLYGLESARGVLRADVQAMGGAGERSALEKVQDLVTEGPALGIQVVAWAQAARSVADVLGRGIRAVSTDRFALRLVFSASADDLVLLTNDASAPLTRDAQALYSLLDNERLFVRPLVPPTVAWLERFSEACERAQAAREREGAPW